MLSSSSVSQSPHLVLVVLVFTRLDVLPVFQPYFATQQQSQSLNSTFTTNLTADLSANLTTPITLNVTDSSSIADFDNSTQLIHYTPSQAINCLQQLPGPFLLLGNSIMRGIFAFLNSMVNQWPELSRAQQKALCERDPVSGSYVLNCNFSALPQTIPIYFDLMIEYCDEPAITRLQSSPQQWASVWLMIGHYPVEKQYGNWHRSALAAKECVPRRWKEWTAQPNHTLVYSTPTQVCSEVVWSLPPRRVYGQLHDSVVLYIEPAYRAAGAHVLDFLTATTGNVSGPYGV